MPRSFQPESPQPMKSEDMTRDLVQLPSVLRRLAEQSAEWQPLAQALLAVDREARAPTGKQLQLELGISPARFRRWLEALYAAYLLLLETEADAVEFRQVEHQVVVAELPRRFNNRVGGLLIASERSAY